MSPLTDVATKAWDVAAGGVIKVLTVNIHKGFTALNRRFMLHELREAVRAIGADVVLPQKVAGSHRPLSLPRKPWSHLSDHAPLAAEISW